MTVSTQSVRLVACGAAVALALGGCTADDPQTSPEATTSPTPTATTGASSNGNGNGIASPTPEGPLPSDEPTSNEPFPANQQPDTNEAGQDAQLAPVDLRLGVHDGYDRVVLDLSGSGVPGWRAEYVENPTQQGSGAPVNLAGDAALKVVVRGVVYPTEEGAEDYQGPQRINPEATGVIEEVAYGSTFEGQAEIFIGLASREPFRVFRLEDPTRIVIDVVHP